MRKVTHVLFALIATLTCGSVLAHGGAGSHLHSGFETGFMHTVTGLDHVVVMLSVGLWSALSARRTGRAMLWGPLGFTNMLLLGTTLGLQGVEVAAVEPLIAASLVTVGLLVVTKMQLQGVWAAALVGLFAVFHGLAHGHELAENAQAFEVLAGLVCATVMLHGTGLALGHLLRGAPVWVPRTIGAAVAILGSSFLLPLN